MATVTSKDGTTISYERLGQGKPVILVDGALCSREFGPSRKLAKLLAERFTVFVYDRRGRGDSGDTRPYSPQREVEDIAALIEAAGGPVSLYGCSSGAGLALESTASGLPVERLALYEPPYMVMDSGPKPPPDYQQQLERMIAEDRRGDAVKYFMRDVIGMPAPMVFIMGMLPMMSGLKAVAHTIPYDTALMNGWAIPKRAASIKTPTLVMDGEKTDVRLRASVAAVTATIPNARRKSLQGQTHNVSAEAMAPELLAFFAA
jgi:pimeloyl-ACP methyl ester carboxylesterase